MRAYLSVARSQRVALTDVLKAVTSALTALNIESFVFVDQHSFTVDQEKEMMRQAMADIEACDLFVAEVSEKAIGVGLEAGYAKAKGKMIIYLRHSNAEHSTTVSGISDYRLVYSGVTDLKAGLEKIIKLWLSDRG